MNRAATYQFACGSMLGCIGYQCHLNRINFVLFYYLILYQRQCQLKAVRGILRKYDFEQFPALFSLPLFTSNAILLIALASALQHNNQTPNRTTQSSHAFCHRNDITANRTQTQHLTNSAPAEFFICRSKNKANPREDV